MTREDFEKWIDLRKCSAVVVGGGKTIEALHLDYVRALFDLLAPKWVPVSEPPKVEGFVAMLYEGQTVPEIEHYTPGNPLEGVGISHWTPLPQVRR